MAITDRGANPTASGTFGAVGVGATPVRLYSRTNPEAVTAASTRSVRTRLLAIEPTNQGHREEASDGEFSPGVRRLTSGSVGHSQYI